MKSVYKSLLPLFIGMALINCAGTDSSSAQKKGEVNPNLFKAGTPVADSLVSGTPEFARSVFKRTIDSVPGEYYYHTTDGRVDTLFQKEGGQYKPIASITYDTLNNQNGYELKKGSCSYFVKNGVLELELDFPKHIKAYWDNGKPREILTGLLYSDDYGVIQVDSGHSELYYKNGKIEQKNNWKNKQPTSSKQWDENGTLVKEIDFPKSYKEYWDNGKPKGVMTGFLYRDEQGNFYLDSGHAEIYFENGKIQQKNDRRNKLLVTQKDWNENGVLTKDVDFPQYYKEYWDDGKPKAILTGRLYRKNQDNFALDSGHLEFYFENGKIKEQSDWKNKLLFANKQWNENGVLINELDFPKSIKEYWDNGNPKAIGIGLFYKDDQGFVWMDRGHSETYFENGKIKGKSDSKDKQVVASKTWNENGVLKKELVFPKYEKNYSDNETLIKELEGTLYYDDQKNVQVQDGFRKEYYDNGKIALHIIYKGKEIVSKTVWNENGVVTISVELPNRYKEFYDDGKIKADVTGTVVEEDDAFKIKEGVYNMYDPNGKVTYSATFKDFQVISEK